MLPNYSCCSCQFWFHYSITETIINQYSGLVDEYDDYEKSIQLKVSDNFLEMARATAKAVQNITALANQFPELKADSQYGKFLEAISENETFISNKREIYNFQVKPEQSNQPTSVEELEQQVLKQNELGKPVETEETKQDDKK